MFEMCFMNILLLFFISRLVILSLFHVTGVLRESIYRGREELKKHHYNNTHFLHETGQKGQRRSRHFIRRGK